MKCPKCDTENTQDSQFCKKCATSLTGAEDAQPHPTQTIETPREELTTGSTFAGRYQIIEELGKGGMGKVYKANDTDIKEKVAIKLIRPEISTDKKTIERFQNELKFARKIRHKNVCQMYDLNKEEGTHYISMEYVEGENLKNMIRMSGQLGMGTAISVAKQVCEGLTEAHKLGVIHRDLKPSNIMIDREGSVRIMDFGIARSLKEKGITGAGVMIGTPEYMSPEQVEGKEVDQRSDIYSLGIILYEMVTGRVPFEGDTALSIAMKHKGESPKDPKEYNAQVPDDLSRLALKCLEKDKDERYQSADSVRAELERLEQGLPITDRVEPPKKPLTYREITVQFNLRKFLFPVLVVIVIVTIGLIIWSPWKQKESASITVDKPSIAVLPFEDLSPQKDQGHLCDGLAESLINALIKIENIRVPARTSSFSFKGKEYDIEEIGEKLNVKTVLEGSIQKAGDRIRITSQLIDVVDESLLWSEQYNRDLDDWFDIQDDIALKIVEILEVKFLGREKAKLVKRYTEDIEAFNLYSKGLLHRNKRTEDDLHKAIRYFEQAVKKDLNYALAFAGMAESYQLLPDYSSMSPEEAYQEVIKAQSAALKALEIDDTLAEAYVALGEVKWRNGWDWVGAEKEYRRAIELNPGLANAHYAYGYALMLMGRFQEAILEMEQALELDPLSLVINRNLGQVFYRARQYDQAIERFHQTIAIDPNFSITHYFLGTTYIKKSMYEEAMREFQKEKEIRGGLYWRADALIITTTALMGKRTAAKKMLDDLIEQSRQIYISPYLIAYSYVALGEPDQCFMWLDKAIEESESRELRYFKVDPLFDDVRNDPRYKKILRKMNLE